MACLTLHFLLYHVITSVTLTSLLELSQLCGDDRVRVAALKVERAWASYKLGIYFYIPKSHTGTDKRLGEVRSGNRDWGFKETRILSGQYFFFSWQGFHCSFRACPGIGFLLWESLADILLGVALPSQLLASCS